MKTSTPYFPPLTKRQELLLEGIKSLKEASEDLPPWDPETGTWAPECYEIRKKMDEIIIKALRSGLLKSRPAEYRHPGFFLEVPTYGGRLLLTGKCVMKEGYGDFHPDLPLWAKDIFVEWIQLQRLRKEGRKNLRRTNIVGLETGIRCPIDLSLMMRTLELRGVKKEEGPTSSAAANNPPLDSLAEMLIKSQRMRAAGMLDNARQGELMEKKRTRVRKERGSWNFVIRQLVKEGLLTKIITHQALKSKLKRLYPDVPWDEV
jgi:hypothetical protein